MDPKEGKLASAVPRLALNLLNQKLTARRPHIKRGASECIEVNEAQKTFNDGSPNAQKCKLGTQARHHRAEEQ